MVSITALGTLPHGSMVTRSGARAGDRIMVTGSIGDAALGLSLRRAESGQPPWQLEEAKRSDLIQRYLLPQPRNALAEAVRLHASASMDVSDGLVGDLAKLLRASGVTAEIAIDRVRLSDAAKRVLAADPAQVETILTGGDDYEIVCTIAPDKVASFEHAAAAARVPVTEIGRVLEGQQPALFLHRDAKPRLFKQTSFSHF
jgi:thiamine-monophosphate kinase